MEKNAEDQTPTSKPDGVQAAVDNVIEKLNATVKPEMEVLTATQEFQKRVIELTMERLEQFYKRFPAAVGVPNMRDAEDWLIIGIKDVLSISTEYQISRR